MKSHGKFLSIPYDFRKPTINKIKNRLWNKNSGNIFVPKVFGAGWTINFHALLKKLNLTK